MRGTHAHQNRNKGHTCFDKWSDNSSDTCQKEQVWPLQVRICQYSWKSWKPPTQLPNNVCKSQVVPLANSIIQPPETTKKLLYEVVRSFSKVVFWGPGPHNAMFNHYPTGSHSTYNNKYIIYKYSYWLVYPVGIDIFPIGYSLFHIGYSLLPPFFTPSPPSSPPSIPLLWTLSRGSSQRYAPQSNGNEQQ